MSVDTTRRRARSLPVVVGVGAIAFVLGCQAVAPPPAATTAPAATRTLAIEASDDAFAAPETVAAGLVTVHLGNHGHEVHHA